MNDMANESKFLCYLDILGFKNRITEDEFKKCYDFIIKKVIEPFDYADKVYLISDSIVAISENFKELERKQRARSTHFTDLVSC